MSNHAYPLPFYIGTGSVLTSGNTSNLVAGQLGIFDAKSYSVASGNQDRHSTFMIAGGSWHTKSQLNKFVGGLAQSDKSIDFFGSDIIEFHRSTPRGAQSEQWVLGYDGIDATTDFSLVCGKNYHFRVRVMGEDVYGTFLRPVERFLTFRTAACADPDSQVAIGSKLAAQSLVDTINSDPELKYFVTAEVISSDYSAPATTHHLFNLAVTDAGDQASLAAVQTAYPTLSVSRISRIGLLSTYQVCTADVTGTPQSPTSFTPSSAISLADCAGACPTNFTLQPARRSWVINRPLASSDDLSSGGAQTTYANTVGTAYYGAKTFDGVTGVNAGTDTITTGSAHGFVVNQSVVYSNGGFTTVPGLTNGNVYYIKTTASSTTFTLSATLGGAVVDITGTGGAGAHSFSASKLVTYLGQNGTHATIQIDVDAIATDITALNSDVIYKQGVSQATCIPAAASAIAWVNSGARYKISRTLTMPLEKQCGTANRLADLTAFYASNSSIVAGSLVVLTAGTCNDIYQVQQFNNDCSVDNCLSYSQVSYTDLPGFEGNTWTPATVAEQDPSVHHGVRITAAYQDTKFGGCSFNPYDYYSVRPLKLEVHQFDDSGIATNVPIAARKTRNVSHPTQSGEYIIRKFIEANKYRAFGDFTYDKRLEDVLDQGIHNVVDRTKFYNMYFLKVRQNRRNNNSERDYAPELFEITFAFPADVDASTFERNIEKVTAQFGVFLKDR
jgi:hypothetical protein